MLCACAAVMLLVLPSPLLAGSALVSGDGEHLWVVQPSDDFSSVRVFHRHIDQPAGVIHLVEKLKGRVSPASVVADDAKLYLVWPTSGQPAVQSIATTFNEMHQTWEYHSEYLPGLPMHAQLRAMATADGRIWALVRLPDLGATTSANPARNGASQQPTAHAGAATEPDDASHAGPTTDDKQVNDGQAHTPTPAQPQVALSDSATVSNDDRAAPANESGDQLLELVDNSWQPVALPTAWSQRVGDQRVSMVWLDDGSDRPILVTRQGQEFQVYRHDPPGSGGGRHDVDDRGWSRRVETVEDELGAPWTARAAAGQLVLAGATTADPSVIQLWIDRPESRTALPPVDMPTPANWPWTVSWVGQDVAVTVTVPIDATDTMGQSGNASEADDTDASGDGASDDNQPAAVGPGDRDVQAIDGLVSGAGAGDTANEGLGGAIAVMRRVTLQGQVGEPVELVYERTSQLHYAANYLLLMVVVIVSTGILLLVWRRDNGWVMPQLPVMYTPAPVIRRAMAAVLDVMVGLLASSAIFAMHPSQVLLHWPASGPTATWQQMLPGTVAIALIVLHTLVGEAVNGRSVGKAVTGLRVVTLTGEKAAIWQVAARCVLKSFDLVFWPLLLLALVNPVRQRLGDLVGRTVVVAQTQTPGGDKSDSDRNEPGGFDERG